MPGVRLGIRTIYLFTCAVIARTDEFCKQGILDAKGAVCCQSGCVVCGGPACAGICCGGWIHKSGRVCSSASDVSCRMPAQKRSYVALKRDADWTHRVHQKEPGDQGEFTTNMFGLLVYSGLKEFSRLLDVGCGSLRLGRLAIPYLNPGHYHCIEPNTHLLRDALHYELGYDMLQRKSPSFSFSSNFTPPAPEVSFRHLCRPLPCKYDYMIAHSIFTYTGHTMLEAALRSLRASMLPHTVLLATFNVKARSTQAPATCTRGHDFYGWLHPQSLCYEEHDLVQIGSEAGLHVVFLDWPHKAQTWVSLCLQKKICDGVASSLPPVPLRAMATSEMASKVAATASTYRNTQRRVLLAITHCCGMAKYTDALLSNIVKEGVNLEAEIVIIEDLPSGRKPDYPEDTDVYSVRHTKNGPRGLTFSWNLAYRVWKFERPWLEVLILSNNDVLYPRGCIGSFARIFSETSTVEGHPYALGPLCHADGCGYAADTKQNIENAFSNWVSSEGRDHLLRLPKAQAKIQEAINDESVRMGNGIDDDIIRSVVLEHHPNPRRSKQRILGFVLAFSREVIGSIFEHSPESFFDPGLVNVGQEEQLFTPWKRGVAMPAMVNVKCFVFHSKAVTLGETNRNNLQRMHGTHGGVK
eukprot:TRINITY_DN65265_c0_g1_i1.p1 TRINITY_DN65265_c0_g1~~TRINITY_DN65265_c0_g1_i1.p1  ORF type:complete len:638 (-),score=40.55 TRINITY_DN65265_c0_g1_i1:342-2255(-)